MNGHGLSGAPAAVRGVVSFGACRLRRQLRLSRTFWEGEAPAEPHHCWTHQPRTIVMPVVADGSAGASLAR